MPPENAAKPAYFLDAIVIQRGLPRELCQLSAASASLPQFTMAGLMLHGGEVQTVYNQFPVRFDPPALWHEEVLLHWIILDTERQPVATLRLASPLVMPAGELMIPPGALQIIRRGATAMRVPAPGWQQVFQRPVRRWDVMHTHYLNPLPKDRPGDFDHTAVYFVGGRIRGSSLIYRDDENLIYRGDEKASRHWLIHGTDDLRLSMAA